MKRYYLIDEADWPHPLPDAEGEIAEMPFEDTRGDDDDFIDPRLRLGEAHFIHLDSLGGPAGKLLVVVPDPGSRPPESWDDKQIPHMLSGQPLTDDHVAALACLGVQPGHTAYHVAKLSSKNTPHFHPHWSPR